MTTLDHGRRILIATLLYALVVWALLAWSWKEAQHPPPSQVRINEVVSLARDPGLPCDKIAQLGSLQLRIEGMDTGLRGLGCVDAPTPAIRFWLRHLGSNGLPAEADQAVWSVILGHPLETLGTGRRLHYDIVLPADAAASGASPQHLVKPGSSFSYRIFQWWSPLAIALVLYVWALLVYLARFSALLRDAAPADAALAARTFSLAKTQMAWWFAIIFASFVFLWLVTGEMPTLSAQALGLLGISSATTLSAVGVAAGRTANDGQSGVFFHDLLSDDNGIAIHRFQMVVMTIALGLMFLARVATRLTMPEFDPSLLALLGISAGTYVGLKVAENRGDAAKAPAPTTADDPKSGYAPTS